MVQRQPREPGAPGWLAPLGSTGITLSGIVAGGGPIGSVPEVYGREVAADEGIATVEAVMSSVIRGIDTSNGYGDGESERRIGAALEARGGVPDDFVVMTKVDPRGRDYSGARVRASIDESRERLGVERLPLVHLHDPEFFSFESLTAPEGAVETLAHLRDSGEVGSIGVAGGDVRELARYVELGVFDVVLVHSRWTLVDRSADDLIGRAAAGMGVLNAAVFGAGMLVDPERAGTYGYRSVTPAVRDAALAMKDACFRHGTELATAALQFSLLDPRITATVVGMSRPSRVGDVLSAASANLSSDLWSELEALCPPDRYWLDAPARG